MELLKVGLEVILKILGIFGFNNDEKKKAEEAIKKATGDYNKTSTDSATVRESHQQVKSKLREAWERRWGTTKEKNSEE
jgi:deoxyribose-phosphate aldolase